MNIKDIQVNSLIRRIENREKIYKVLWIHDDGVSVLDGVNRYRLSIDDLSGYEICGFNEGGYGDWALLPWPDPSGDKLKIEIQMCPADTLTLNGRVYSADVLKKAVENIEKNRALEEWLGDSPNAHDNHNCAGLDGGDSK